MINLSLSPEDEARLRERAAAAGKDVAEYVRDVVEEDLAATEPVSLPDSHLLQKRRQWEQDLDAWAAGHPRLDTFADDSREGIYTGRGE